MLRLTADDRRTLAQAMVLIPLVALVLRLAGLRRCQRIFSCFLLRNRVRETEPAEATIARAFRISRLVEVAVRHGVCRANCLQRSLTLWRLLRHKGISGELRIGARKVAGRLDAHAWIEIEGVVLNDSSDVHSRYEPFDREILRQFTGS